MGKKGNWRNFLVRAAQYRTVSKRRKKEEKQTTRKALFEICVSEQEKVLTDLRCIGSDQANVLEINDEVLGQLKEKHQEEKCVATTSLQEDPLPIKPV